MKEIEEYAVNIHGAIASLFDGESEGYTYSLDDVDGTKFFTGFVIAFNLLFNELTDNDDDLVDTVHKINRLVVQHLLDANKEESE